MTTDWTTVDEATARAKVAELAIGGDELRRVICGLIGHSRIVDEEGDARAWRVCCARCGAIVDRKRESEVPDDRNGSMLHLERFEASTAVFRQHAGCATCAENSKTLTWRDLWEVQLGQTDGRTE